ncbi:MAG: LysM repeat protein [Granulosicoccus sp.]|jgi:LysM repeat protein
MVIFYITFKEVIVYTLLVFHLLIFLLKNSTMKQVNVLLLFLFAAFNSFGTSIYIDYNASKDCMDSYEYAKDGNEETPYLFFHLKVSDNEKIILEAGEEYTPRQYKPAGTETCAELERDEKFVDEVNNGTLEVFLVQEHTYGFRIYKVKKAEYYYNTNIAFGTRSDNYSFSYYYNQASTGNLATKGSKADVYFSEKDDNDCLSRYKFRIKTDPARNSMADLTILPEIGILYKKSDPMPPLAVGEKLELRKINNYNIVDYLGLICKFYGGQPKTTSGDTSPNNPGDLSANNADVPMNPNINTNPIINTPNGGINVTGGNSGGSGLLSGGSTGGYTSTVYPGAGRIYLDLDKGYYVDSTNGLRAEGDFGGNSYRNGYMINKNTGTTTTVPSTGTNIPAVPTTTVNDDSGCLEVSTNDTHIVQKKETLYTIARTHGLDINDVKKWNEIGANNRIYPCMRLTIVPPVEKPSKGAGMADCLEQPTYNTHVVQKRETLYSIAATYGVTVNQIKAWNGLRRDAIYPCTRLMIQPPSDYQIIRQVPAQSAGTTYYIRPQTAPATVTPATQPQSYAYVGAKGAKYHTVAKSETLFRIAAVYGLKVAELKRINGLTSDMIKPGQVLLISDAVAGNTRLIQVPTQRQAVPQEYLYINPALAGNRTAQGQPLVTGKGDELIEMNVDGTQRLIHIVQDEDTMHNIAQKYKTTVAQLRSLNDMDRNEVIVPFQRLYVR